LKEEVEKKINLKEGSNEKNIKIKAIKRLMIKLDIKIK
jgi:hypothetical protein